MGASATLGSLRACPWPAATPRGASAARALVGRLGVVAGLERDDQVELVDAPHHVHRHGAAQVGTGECRLESRWFCGTCDRVVDDPAPVDDPPFGEDLVWV